MAAEARGGKRRWAMAVLLGFVVLVVFLGVVRWRRHTASIPSASDLQRAEVAALMQRLRARPTGEAPEDPLAVAEADEAAGRAGLAAETLADALGQNPEDADLRLALASLALRTPVPAILNDAEARALVAVAEADTPAAPGLPAARAWRALAEGDIGAALAALGADPGTPSGLWAGLRADLLAGQDPSARAAALLEKRPGHGEACAVSARSALADAEFGRLRKVVESCVANGARASELQRLLGDAADTLGQFEAAAAAYAAGGASLHAAAVLAQEGLPDPDGLVAAALAEPVPPAALHGVWVGLLRGDLAAAEAASARLRSFGAVGPEFSMALAATALAAGRPAEALAGVKALSSAEASVLSARAAAATGDRAAASAAFGAALAAQPWNLAIVRERLAWLAGVDPAAASAAAVAAAEIDPITASLAADYRRRDAPWPALAPSPWPSLPGSGGALVAAARGEPSQAPDPAWPAEVRGLLAMHRAWALGQDDPPSARAVAAEATAVLPRDPGSRLVAAELARRAGDDAEARRLVSEAEALIGAPPPPSANGEPPPPHPNAAALAWVSAHLRLADGDRSGARDLLRAAALQQPELSGLWQEIDALDRSGP